MIIQDVTKKISPFFTISNEEIISRHRRAILLIAEDGKDEETLVDYIKEILEFEEIKNNKFKIKGDIKQEENK